MESVDRALSKDIFAGDKGAKEEFDLAYGAYADLVGKIAREVMKAERAVMTSDYFSRIHFGSSKDTARDRQKLQNARQGTLSADNRDLHKAAVRDLLGKIPYRYSNFLDVWQATGRDQQGYWVRLDNEPRTPCVTVWTKRFGNKKLADTLHELVGLAWILCLGSVFLRFVELFVGTCIVAWLQVSVVGLLWSIYYDAPRLALLWILRKIDAQLDGIPNRDEDSQQSYFVVEELKVWRRS